MAKGRRKRATAGTRRGPATPGADYDSPWKDALDRYFERCLAFFFPHIHAEIDWSRGYEMLDKELQPIIRRAERGRLYVDKLVKVWLEDGQERWILIHIEVQASREGEFAERMHVYNHRIADRYGREVISLAILIDDDPNWRPSRHEYIGTRGRSGWPRGCTIGAWPRRTCAGCSISSTGSWSCRSPWSIACGTKPRPTSRRSVCRSST
jgi:hypothetical protein